MAHSCSSFWVLTFVLLCATILGIDALAKIDESVLYDLNTTDEAFVNSTKFIFSEEHDVRRRLAASSSDPNSHRVEPIGFDWYSPWASGTFLRRPRLPIVKDKVSVIEQLKMKTERPNVDLFTHCFIVNGPLPSRSIKLFGMLTSVLPSTHKLRLLNATGTTKGRTYRPSHQLGFVAGQVDMTAFSSFVVLDSKNVGPFFPPYFDHNQFPVWTDAYTSLLTDDVRIVGRALVCTSNKGKSKSAAEKSVPSIEGPLVLDRVGLELASGTGFEIFGEKLVYATLRAGYNIAAMHGQPRGHDWRRWLQKPPGVNDTLCSTEIPNFFNHPYEGLFVSRNKKLAAGFEGVYMKSVRKNMEHKSERQMQLINSKMDDDHRLLVLYAYYEKTPQYKENLLFFLKTAVGLDARNGAPVDYIIIVNGEHTVQFPNLINLEVILRNNSCLDFGSWGVGLTKRTKKHTYFFVINASVKGPFLPTWFTDHWSRSFISQLHGDMGAVGLSVNCPDGVGRGVPHIMSMAVMFDRRVMELAEKKGLFMCVESYQVGLSRESDFSIAILDAGYNIASMQTAQNGMDFRELYKEYLKAPKGDIKSGCVGIDLDIFFKEGWYQGMSPNPMEFVFLKVSRDVNTQTTDIVTSIQMENARHHIAVLERDRPKHILMLMHSMDMDGAPRLLFEMGAMLIKKGYRVTFAAWAMGALSKNMIAIGSEPMIIKSYSGGSINSIVEGLYLDVDLVVLNTVVWSDLIGKHPYVRTGNPKIMWLIHENELSPEHALANSNGDKFWYGMEFKSIATEHALRNTLHKVDKVVFVADKVRAIWSKYDTGNFETFRGFVVLPDVEKRASKGLDPSSREEIMKSIGATKDTFIITTLGTVCKRKGQFLLAQALENVGSSIFGSRKYMLLVVGAPSAAGGRGDNSYFEAFSAYVNNSRVLTHVVKFVPFSEDALAYIAISNLHMSVSLAEAFPLNVLEAMALSVPVMVTPAGGSEEAFTQPGVDGLLIPLIESREQLETHLLRQLKGKLDKLPAIGAAGRETLISRFTATASQSRLTKLVDRVFDNEKGPNGNLCIVVRTFAGHLSDPIFSLRNFLMSLKNQHYRHWTAFVVNTDSKPMDGLYSLLSELDDHRFHVVDPPGEQTFRLGAFDASDRVVQQQCPQDSDWLLVTNGDNFYEPSFLDHLDLSYDIVAYDFYSRYNHILDSEVVGIGCNKFFEGGNVACKKNLLKHWHTDLGSYVINYKRWMLEGRSFVALEKDGDGSADGHVAESLVYYGWPVKSVVQKTGGCLFSHSPNMFHCLNNSVTKEALWDADGNRCVVDPVEQATLRATHTPYFSPVLPYSMQLFQDRCMDVKR